MASFKALGQLNSKEIKDETQTDGMSEICVSTSDDVSGTSTSIHNGNIASSALSLLTDNDAIIGGDMDLFLKSILDQGQAKLALSEDINDVADVFRQMDERSGKAEFVIAVMLSFIHEEKLWMQYGYSSMTKFLDDLPSVCKVTRQTFTNAAQAGKIIRYLSAPFFQTPDSKLDFELTPALLYRNYSKVKFLYRIFYVWNLYLTNEVLINFRDMTYRDFESFMKEYEIQNQSEIERLGKRSKKSLQDTNKASGPKSQLSAVPELNEIDTEICREIRSGHGISYLFTTYPECVQSVIQFLNDARKHEYDRVWRYSRSPFNLALKHQPDISLDDINWAEFFPENLNQTTETITGLLNSDLAPHDVKNAMAKAFKTKTELTLAQAYLIHRIEMTPTLFNSISHFLFKSKIPSKHSPLMDFAINILDIEASRYKWLKRIGRNLPLLTKLGGKVQFTSEGFLEKLSYLDTAINCHHFEPELVVNALNRLSVRRFREFASNIYDNLSSDQITMLDYQMAKPFIEKLRLLQAEGRPVTAISLQSETEQAWLDKINDAMEEGNEHKRKFYPGIIWDTNFHVEHTAQINSEEETSEQGHFSIVEKTSKDSLNSSFNDYIIEKAA